MTIFLQNKTGAIVQWCSKVFQVDEYRDITSVSKRFANNNLVLIAVANGTGIVAKLDDGNNDITDVSVAINYLKRLPEQTDVDGIPLQRIEVKEEFTPFNQTATGGRYQAQSFELQVDHAQGTWKNLDISWPFPVSIFSTEWVNYSTYEGDIVRVVVGEDTIIGAITANVSAAQTVIPVSQTVIDNIAVGYNLKLFDGTNTDDLGRVLVRDSDNLELTMEVATTNSFLAATPTYCLQTVEFIPHFRLGGLGRVELAKDIVGGSYLAPNTILRVKYLNNEGTTTNKVFSFVLEYKY